MKVSSIVLEKEIRDSNRYLFWLYAMAFGSIGFYIGLILFDERYRYYLAVFKPHIMKRVTLCEDWSKIEWDKLNQTYDLPKDASWAAVRKLYQSIKRVRMLRQLEHKDKEVTALIEDAKEIDKKLLDLERKLTGTNLQKS